MAWTTTDRDSIKAAILTLATREAATVSIGGRTVSYNRNDIPVLLELLTAIEMDIASAADNGGLNLVKPGGRT